MRSTHHLKRASLILAVVVASVGCGDSTDNMGGNGGVGGAAGGGGVGGAGGMGGTPLELVRFRVSALAGDEDANLASTTNPELFVLDASISAAEIVYENEAFLNKQDEGPATYLPALTPILDPGDNPGFIELRVTPQRGQSVISQRLTYTTSAKFASNPSSLALRSSQDSFATDISVINLDQERTETASLTDETPLNSTFSFRWVAGNEFGAMGGGAAGFTTNDIILEGAVAP